MCNKWTDGIREDWEEEDKCFYIGAEKYCSQEKVSAGVCGLWNDSQYFCSNPRDWSKEYKAYKQCEEAGYEKYCLDDSSNDNVCSGGHPKMATVLLAPFILNYIFCFITFLRLGTNKKITFIFPLLNLYPQFGTKQCLKCRRISLIYSRGCEINLCHGTGSKDRNAEEKTIRARYRTSWNISRGCPNHSYHDSYMDISYWRYVTKFM